jgi:hypothetical protein
VSGCVSQIYAEPLCRRHHVGIVSFAVFIRIFLLCTAIGLALVVAYATGGFWVKIQPTLDQATVHYTNDALLVFQVRHAKFACLQGVTGACAHLLHTHICAHRGYCRRRATCGALQPSYSSSLRAHSSRLTCSTARRTGTLMASQTSCSSHSVCRHRCPSSLSKRSCRSLTRSM